MEFFTVLPVRKYLDKKIAIYDLDNIHVGFIQRKYKGFWDKIIHYSPLSLSFLETINIVGETDDTHVKIREHSFTSNLVKKKWDLYLKVDGVESENLLEDRTKISTNPRLVYHKNNEEYIFKIDLFNRTCEINSNNNTCATVRLEKRIPPSFNAVLKTCDFTIAELLGIYYLIYLTY